MGGAQSTNSSYLSQFTNADVSTNCSSRTLQEQKDNVIQIGQMTCKGTMRIGVQDANSVVSCSNTLASSVAGKAMTMQDAKAVAGFMSTSSSKTSNANTTEQGVRQALAARCSNDVSQVLSGEQYQLTNVEVDGDCDFNTQQQSTSFACVQNATQNSDLTATVKQTAKSKSVGALGALLAILMICIVVFMGPEIAASFLIPKPHPDFQQNELDKMGQVCAKLKGDVSALKAEAEAAAPA